MNEENNINNTTNETNPTTVTEPETVTQQPVETPAPVEAPTQTETPAPAEAPASVEAPVQTEAPAQPTIEVQGINPAPTAELVPAKKKSNPIVVILLILVLLGVCGYGLYTYTDIFKPKKNNNAGTTTTTTTTTTAVATEADGEFPITSFEDYIAIVKKNTKSTNNDNSVSSFELIDLDNKTLRIDYDMDNKCVNDGDKVTIPVGTTNVEYTCKRIVDEDSAEETLSYWNIEVGIKDTFKTSKTGWSTCQGFIDFTDGKNVFEFVTSCGMGGTSFTLSKIDNESKLKLEKYEAYLIDKDPSKFSSTPAIIKDNTLYFVEADAAQDDTVSTCRIKSVDLTADTFTKNDLGLTTECYYTHGE